MYASFRTLRLSLALSFIFRAFVFKAFIFMALLFTGAQVVMALPFNDDMVDSQIKTGQVMRPRPPGSRPIGAHATHLESKAEAQKMENPRRGDAFSATTGERLFAVNCMPCHGQISRTNYVPGPVAKFLPGPNLADPSYNSRSDGDFFATMYFGNILMPALGWKLSHDEAWDIVNYIRQVQNEE